MRLILKYCHPRARSILGKLPDRFGFQAPSDGKLRLVLVDHLHPTTGFFPIDISKLFMLAKPIARGSQADALARASHDQPVIYLKGGIRPWRRH